MTQPQLFSVPDKGTRRPTADKMTCLLSQIEPGDRFKWAGEWVEAMQRLQKFNRTGGTFAMMVRRADGRGATIKPAFGDTERVEVRPKEKPDDTRG